MNICYLTRDYPPNLLGGVGAYTHTIAKALSALGHKIYVITETDSIPCESIEDGVHVFRIKSKPLFFPKIFRDKLKRMVDRLEYSAAASKKLSQIVKTHKIDIVESCEARAEGFWYYLFHRNPPLVIKLHTPETIACQIDNIPFDLDAKLVDKLEQFWIFRSRKLVAVTEAIIKLVSQYYKFNFFNLPVVYYPVDVDMFQPDTYKPFVDCPKILFAGRLEIRKGVLTLLEAIPSVLKQFPKAKFYFVGQDAGVKHLMNRKIMELGCASNVVFINQVERKDMIKIYQSADICVFPSLWENFAYVALEAMACGKAVIASRVGGFLEMIDDEVNGLLCNPNDSADLADKINYALANKDILDDLGINARKKIVKEYSPGYRAEKMITIYEQIL